MSRRFRKCFFFFFPPLGLLLCELDLRAKKPLVQLAVFQPVSLFKFGNRERPKWNTTAVAPPRGALSACTKWEKWSGKTGGRANFERLMCHEWMQESRESVWRGEGRVRLANPEDVAVNSTVFGVGILGVIF